MDYPIFQVFIRCFTYNQSKYISEALDSFCMQETTFPYICCIVDDNSTDGEQDVVRKYIKDNFENAKESLRLSETEYAKIVYARHKYNRNCYIVVLFLKENLYSKKKSNIKFEYIDEWRKLCKYEAFCEGDDWWLSSDKLQRQFDVMESHSEIDMCACGAVCYLNGEACDAIAPTDKEKILSTDEVIRGGGGFLSTNSLFYRMDYLHDSYLFWKIKLLDYSIQIRGSLRGGIYYLPERMAAYRMFSSGSWSIKNKRNLDFRFDTNMELFSALDVLNYETKGKYAEAINGYKSENSNVFFQQAYSGTKYNDVIKKISLGGRIKIMCYFIMKLFSCR